MSLLHCSLFCQLMQSLVGLLLSGLCWAAASFQVINHPQRLTENVWKEFLKVFLFDFNISIFVGLSDKKVLFRGRKVQRMICCNADKCRVKSTFPCEKLLEIFCQIDFLLQTDFQCLCVPILMPNQAQSFVERRQNQINSIIIFSIPFMDQHYNFEFILDY